jgi:hypothetical protein
VVVDAAKAVLPHRKKERATSISREQTRVGRNVFKLHSFEECLMEAGTARQEYLTAPKTVRKSTNNRRSFHGGRVTIFERCTGIHAHRPQS